MAIITSRAESTPQSPIQGLPRGGTEKTPSQEAPQTIETEKNETAQDPQTTARFAALARKEKAIRAEQIRIKQKEEELKSLESKYQNGYVSKEDMMKKAQSDLFGHLSEMGFTPETITNALLNTNPTDLNLRELQKRLAAIEEKTNGVATTLETKEKEAFERAVNKVRHEVKSLVSSSPEFDMIKSTGSEEAVVELIKDTFQKTGVELSKEEACKEIEEYLFNESLKLLENPKIKSRLTPQAQPEATAPTASKPLEIRKQNPIQTLTNAIRVQTSNIGNESDRERRQRAIDRYNSFLKK